ncbi:hypothetical protein [Mycobacteroides abscessus]|uniref:hypothetical protein n=1 Tax=Mycobacteroides abscessus TaxID=36809 RepID=UPI001878BAE9|nr:hypothetical protein [Mycobacteroides abscessus]
MITELRLVSNHGESTAAFWGAVFNTPPTDLGGGRWRVTPVAGPTVTITTARVAEAITSVDMTVVTDHGAADRLCEAGFEVAHDGSAAVDVNGCDNTVFLVERRGWDGRSDVPWAEPTPGQAAAITGSVVRIETDAVAAVAAFLSAWFNVTPETLPSGAARFPIRNTLIRVAPVREPRRQWVPLGIRYYAEAVERCAAAGFTVTPSPTHADTAGHVDVGECTFLLMELHRERDDAYYAEFSAAIERGDYKASGPVELGTEREDPQ